MAKVKPNTAKVAEKKSKAKVKAEAATADTTPKVRHFGRQARARPGS